MITLGLNAAYHDSSAALVRDGVVIAAAADPDGWWRDAEPPVAFAN